MSHYLDKIKRYSEWNKAFNYLIEKNESAHLPYHNNKHSIGVFNTAIDMADSYELSEKETLNLGIACLFHDFNHSGGKLSDDNNIINSTNEFIKFFATLSERQRSYVDYDRICSMILYTIYPRVGIPSTLSDQIIVDSDLLQCYDTDWFIFAVKGLSDERGVTVKQALQDQTNFINNVEFYTDYARELHEELKEGYLEQLEYLKTIFN